MKLGALYEELTGLAIAEELLDWPPDVFLLTDRLLARSEAYRFAVSPPPGRAWPPRPDWSAAVADAARRWSAAPPDLVVEHWTVLRKAAATPLDEVASGRDWAVVEALLTLHATADEACAGVLGGRGRELLARTGSLARSQTGGLRVLPKVRTPPAGISPRSLSRYVCVPRAPVEVVWDKLPNPPPAGTGGGPRRPRILLLPWPLSLEPGAFVPVQGSIRRPEQEPFGFFRFEPGGIDVELLERVVAAAAPVDVCVLPEGSVAEAELAAVEDVLARHRVQTLIAGMRAPGRNWVHIAVWLAGRWRRYPQNKHHRWSLDRGQIEQYHLGDALDPDVRWWEEMDVPRRSVRIVEFGAGVAMVSLICEDLARLDDVAELVRSVGPSLIVTPLLDGPQLPSRWTARYAGVLADDPGSAVVTLSCLGMVQRSRPPGLPPSSVVALWKDPVRGLREIALEDGAHGVVLTAAFDRTHRHTADGRPPSTDTGDFYVVDVEQVRAPAVSQPPPPRKPPSGPSLDSTELTILASWAEAVATSPDAAADARPGAEWRAKFGVQEPDGQLAAALTALADVAGGAFDGSDLHRLASRLLQS
jgi:hypothetical protein